MIAHCVALLVVLLTTMLSPATPPAWDRDAPQLCEGQLEQPRGAIIGQADLELQDADDVERTPARVAGPPSVSLWLTVQTPLSSHPPHVVGRASLRDQRQSIRRLKTYAHVPRMESDPSPS